MSKHGRVTTTASAGFGVALRQLRDARRLSQANLAFVADFDHSYVSRLEAGTRQPTSDAVGKLCLALQATPDEKARLLGAAGFASDAPISDPTVSELASLLSDETVSEFVRETVRQQVHGAVWLAQQQQRSAA